MCTFKNLFRLILAAVAMSCSSIGMSSEIIGTFAGTHNGSPMNFVGFGFTAKIVRDSQNVLYVSDSASGVIWAIPPNGKMSIIAGNGLHGATLESGIATQIALGSPVGMSVDAAGALYFADAGNSVVRKVSPSGFMTTVVGNGTPGYSGDGGVATQAQLNSPNDVVLDSRGNMYISDYNNNKIRKVDLNGNISTVAGTGIAGFSGDGGPAVAAQLNLPTLMDIDSADQIFFSDSGNNRVRKLLPNGSIMTIAGNGVAGVAGDNGVAIAAQLNFPIGISLDGSGDIFIADYGNARVRKVDANGMISTFAGNGLYADSGGADRGDYGLAINASIYNAPSIVTGLGGNLFIADVNHLKKIDSRGIIVTYVGNGAGNMYGDGGPAGMADFTSVFGVAVDSHDNVYVSDTGSSRIRRISSDGYITAVAGCGISGLAGDGGPAVDATFYFQHGIAFDKQDNLYIADWGNQAIRKVDTNGIITTVAGGSGDGGYDGDGGPAILAHLSFPTGVAVDSVGNVYFSDEQNSVVRVISTDGKISTLSLGTWVLRSPQGLAFDKDDNLFIADKFDRIIVKVTKLGVVSGFAGSANGHVGDGRPAIETEIGQPVAVRSDGKGNIYIASNLNVMKVDANGILTTVAGVSVSNDYSGDGGPPTAAGLYLPSDIAFDSRGNYYIADSANWVVRKVTVNGDVLVNLDQRGLTGAWYNAATSGQGVVIESYEDLVDSGKGYLSAGWYTFDAYPSGERRWYTLQGPANSGGDWVSLGIYTAVGGTFNAIPKVSAIQVGTATLAFADCLNGALNFRFNDGRTGTIALSRLDPNVSCSTSGTDSSSSGSYLLSGAWYNPSISGQGFFFDINPKINLMFAAWYTYAPNSSETTGTAGQRWYTIQDNAFSTGTTSKAGIPIYETTGGTFNTGKVVAGQPVGTADIEITDCSSMKLSFAFTSGSNSGQVGSIVLSRIVGAPAGCSVQ